VAIEEQEHGSLWCRFTILIWHSFVWHKLNIINSFWGIERLEGHLQLRETKRQRDSEQKIYTQRPRCTKLVRDRGFSRLDRD
jgi:hypothetical protein